MWRVCRFCRRPTKIGTWWYFVIKILNRKLHENTSWGKWRFSAPTDRQTDGQTYGLIRHNKSNSGFRSPLRKCVCNVTNLVYNEGMLVDRISLVHSMKWTTSNNEFPSFFKVRHFVSKPTKSMELLSLFSIKLSSTIDLCFQFPSDTRFCVHPLPTLAHYFHLSCRELWEGGTAKPTFPWQLVIFAAQVKIRTAPCRRLQNFISYSQLHFLAGNIFC